MWGLKHGAVIALLVIFIIGCISALAVFQLTGCLERYGSAAACVPGHHKRIQDSVMKGRAR